MVYVLFNNTVNHWSKTPCKTFVSIMGGGGVVGGLVGTGGGVVSAGAGVGDSVEVGVGTGVGRTAGVYVPSSVVLDVSLGVVA